MRLDLIDRFLLFLLGLVLVLPTFLPNKTITESYFDNRLIVEVTHNGSLYAHDKVTFVFEEAGSYLVTFLPVSASDSFPNSFAITIESNETPQIKTVKKWSINNMTIIISKDGVSESHDFIYPH